MAHKGQVALEFLTTYGWAILVVIGVSAGLVYFGLFNPQRLIPERCSIGEGFTCKDFQLTKGDPAVAKSEVSLYIQNTLGDTVNLSKMEITYNGQSGDVNCGIYNYYETGVVNTYVTLVPGATAAVTCNPGNGVTIQFAKAGDKDRVKFKFNYTLTADGFPHPVEGEIIARVQSQ